MQIKNPNEVKRGCIHQGSLEKLNQQDNRVHGCVLVQREAGGEGQQERLWIDFNELVHALMEAG